ncbi:hypothetical protein CDAR_281281 [Caerostris darwini]|uniref:Uncharacterized protein n=1 Tax=Caerostris darwini TaxID=1538125 RepID=A0AAV4WV73_9ARAC|nr:hypothetical protein CDAR_281281 [Caerostris darwini]
MQRMCNVVSLPSLGGLPIQNIPTDLAHLIILITPQGDRDPRPSRAATGLQNMTASDIKRIQISEERLKEGRGLFLERKAPNRGMGESETPTPVAGVRKGEGVDYGVCETVARLDCERY